MKAQMLSSWNVKVQKLIHSVQHIVLFCKVMNIIQLESMCSCQSLLIQSLCDLLSHLYRKYINIRSFPLVLSSSKMTIIKYINIRGDRMVRYGGFEAFLGRQSCKILGQTLTLSLRRHQLHPHQQDYLDVHHNLLCFGKSLKIWSGQRVSLDGITTEL